MGMIFPGMDPYLEGPLWWVGVHASFIVYARDHLQELLGDRYVAGIEDRVFLEGPGREVSPDPWLRQDWGPPSPRTSTGEAQLPILVEAPEMEVRETYVTILDRQSGQRIVTAIELLSPTNKYAGPGRESYLTKQRETRASRTHLVEIDLLRFGPHVLAVPSRVARHQGPFDYLVSVNRAGPPRHIFELYPLALRNRLPSIRVPLAEGDPDVLLDMQSVLEQVYRKGSYRRRLDYSAPCGPPLAPLDQEWANERIREAANG